LPLFPQTGYVTDVCLLLLSFLFCALCLHSLAELLGFALLLPGSDNF
jgi:membrane glycosyltransferase